MRVASCGLVGDCTEPLPLRAPRLRRFWVDTERELAAPLTVRPMVSGSSSTSSISWSGTVERTEVSAAAWAGTSEGTRDMA